MREQGGKGKRHTFRKKGDTVLLQVSHDSFYHGPICHYIDNCLGPSAGHAMS
jgi:hypothetical protein